MSESMASPCIPAATQEKPFNVSVEAFRLALQVEVDEHVRAIASLRIRMNTVIPVARLPSEILSHIFTVYAAMMKNYYVYTQWHRGPPHYNWIDVTHVCHHWREVALADPRLWADILVAYGQAERVEELLNRSKRANLRVKIDTSAYKWHPTLQRIAREADRIETLHVIYDDPEKLSVFEEHLSSRLPVLRSLTLKCLYHRQTRLLIPLATLATSCLQALDISVYCIDWASIALPQTLVSLQIEEVCRNGLLESSASDIAYAIGKLQALETFRLHSAIEWRPQADTVFPTPATTYVLPRIQSFTLEGSFLQNMLLFDHFTLPPSCRILLDFLDARIREHELTTILSRSLSVKLNAQTVDDDRRPITKLEVDPHHLRLYRTSNSFTISAEPDVLVIIRSSPLFQNDISFRKLLPHLPLGSVETLALFSMPYLPSAWPCTLQAVPNVQNLILGGTDLELYDVCDILGSGRAVLADSSPQANFLLPLLSHLSLRCIRFKDSDKDSDDFEAVETLQTIIRLRGEQGSKLGKMDVEQCFNMYEADIGRLREVVDVDWDNYVEFEEADTKDEDSDADNSEGSNFTDRPFAPFETLSDLDFE
ncbi:hypothetical protein EIP91_005439 [Steccherinum ochraceum]|uniref:Uncharacterized protein n=1 Tax=Steccherinum ochraceum TaxID=92696 RepID=A0A4R0RVI9_9APHY|nr:hypothetical protein EIP91_005439 [Steccherinum ochraceum]